MKKDGVYSWIVLVAIILSNFCSMGYIFCNAALYSDVYPDLLGIDQTKANTISSSGVAILLFTGEYLILKVQSPFDLFIFRLPFIPSMIYDSSAYQR